MFKVNGDGVLLVESFDQIETDVDFEETEGPTGLKGRDYANGVTAITAETFAQSMRDKLHEIIDQEF